MIPCKTCGAARTAACKPGCGKRRTYREPDDQLRYRICQKYGMEDFFAKVYAATGETLDAYAIMVGLKRIVVEVPDTFEGEG